MAWASRVVLCLGRAEAERRLQTQRPRADKRAACGRRPAKPQPAKESLFTMGWHLAHRWLDQRIRPHLRWLLDDLSPLSWTARWFQSQAHLFVFYKTVRPRTLLWMSKPQQRGSMASPVPSRDGRSGNPSSRESTLRASQRERQSLVPPDTQGKLLDGLAPPVASRPPLPQTVHP